MVGKMVGDWHGIPELLPRNIMSWYVYYLLLFMEIRHWEQWLLPYERVSPKRSLGLSKEKNTVLGLCSVTQKLRDVRHEDIPEINNPKII